MYLRARKYISTARLFALGAFAVFGLVFLVSSQRAYAVDGGFVTCGSEVEFPDPTQATATCATDEGNSGSINDVIINILNVISVLVGVVAVFMIILAGFRYITSNGDPGSIKSARDTVIYAIVGLIVVVLAQGIVRVVVGFLGDETE